MAKVTFDGVTKVISVLSTVTSLDIRVDVYSAWVDWIATADNLKYLPAIRVTGLDQIGPGVYTGDVYFLINGWKLSLDFTKVRVTGVLYSDDYETAYYTPGMVAQFPATVSALVNTVSTSGSSGPTAADIWNYTDRTLTQTGAGGGATLAEIESSTVLAKSNQIPQANTIAAAVRTELAPELAHVLTLENQTAGLTPTQATMILEMYELLGLDITKPLIVTENARVAGSISQNIVTTSTETIITRV